MVRGSAGRWVIILAGGQGRRVGHLTRAPDGTTVPKQYWDFGIGTSLLHLALDRAGSLVPRERTLVVVDEHHRPFWQPALRDLPDENVVVQARDQGTAIGVLGPLRRIALRDPRAVILSLPSDQFVEREAVFAESLDLAFREAESDPRGLVVLGVPPYAPDPDYGWLLAGPPLGPDACRVAAFVERPSDAEAERMLGSGGLWSSFVFAARVTAIREAFRSTQPQLLRAFQTRARRARLDPLAPIDLEGIEPADFSRDVLQPAVDRLKLVAARPCGWTDLGTPARVRAWQERRSALLPVS